MITKRKVIKREKAVLGILKKKRKEKTRSQKSTNQK